MFIKKPSDIKSSEITPKTLYINRRQFMAVAASLAAAGLAAEEMLLKTRAWAGQKLPVKKRGEFSVEEKQTSFKDATHYNNFYEFSTDKEDVAELASKFRTRPWTISIEGHVKQSKVYDIDALIKMFPLEERVYRFRCVEAWSMVLPWVGFALGDFIKICEPTSKAKYVKFTTIFSPEQMPGQKTSVLQWPYEEGLRMDEAVHPLTLLTVGMYGEILPNQNGAPLRLVVPWKYGFKNIKSIVKISFVEEMPVTTWMKAGPREYGFYANVNPDVDHPRWSQAQERRIGEFLKKKTLMFNGYAEQVAGLYKGMDLRKFF
ncbi:MAG TPA: protein-methionine-sulfoxide reductase catalytic subunit MsrP [Thermodesulfovibrionia bacterium]|nr:protein-methionine-sulfoxide reductase catalytic subunit MsrP [Thermodesulfovibrionia bacterium]